MRLIGLAVVLAYDAAGRRTRKTIYGLTTDFVHDGLNPVTESSAGGTGFLLTGLGVDDFMMRIGPVSTSMFLTDALGSLVATTDAAGGLQSEVTYEPFGNTEMSAPPQRIGSRAASMMNRCTSTTTGRATTTRTSSGLSARIRSASAAVMRISMHTFETIR